MKSRELVTTQNLTCLLKKTGAGQIAKSEEILSWGCDAVLEPVTAAPSPVFLRGALAEHSRQYHNWCAIKQLAEDSPQFGQRVMNLDGRNNLGGVSSDRYEEFEQNRSVPLSSH